MFHKKNCFEVKDIKINHQVINGYIIAEHEEVINDFIVIAEEILRKKSHINSNGLNQLCKKEMPDNDFFLTIKPDIAPDKEKIEHPAYGLVRFFNCSGSPRSLFGTSIKHQNAIVMEVCHAYATRTLNNDHHFDDKLIARVEMSRSQFADLITSVGNYSGSPCTIKYTELVGDIDYPETEDKKAEFRKEFDEKLKNAGESVKEMMNEIQEVFDNKKNLTKADKTKIMNNLAKIYNDITVNSSFVNKCFTEQMEKTVHEAKGEIEAYIDNKMKDIANDALAAKKETNLLLENFGN